MSVRQFSLLLLTLWYGVAVHAQPVELRFFSASPPRSPYNTKVLEPWVKEINEAGKGRVQIQFSAGFALASQQNIYDRVTTNVVPMGWGIQSFFPGKFPKSEVPQLPLIYESAKEGSEAFWTVYKSGLLDDEYKDVKLLTVFAFPQNQLHATQPIRSLADLKGMKVGAFGTLRMKLVSAMGATPIAVPPPKLYESMNRGVITGMVMGYSAFPAYKLQEVTKYHLDVPVGGQPGMVFMNKQVWNKLPKAVKDIIDAHSGEKLMRLWAQTADAQVGFGRGLTRKAKNQTFSSISVEDRAEWTRRFEPVYAEWSNTTPKGDQVLSTFRAAIARQAGAGK